MSPLEGGYLITSILLAPVMAAVQTAFVRHPGGPDLFIPLAAVAGWNMSPWLSAITGFVIGMCEDAFSGRLAGVFSLSCALASLTSSYLRKILRPNWWSLSFASVCAGLVSEVSATLLLLASGVKLDLVRGAREMLIPVILWSCMFSPAFDLSIRPMALLLSKVWPWRERKDGFPGHGTGA